MAGVDALPFFLSAGARCGAGAAPRSKQEQTEREEQAGRLETEHEALPRAAFILWAPSAVGQSQAVGVVFRWPARHTDVMQGVEEVCEHA